MLTFFHNSDEYREEFTSQDNNRPSFYWFNDRYHNHLSLDSRCWKYFYLFVKDSSKDSIAFRSRHEDYGFHSLYEHYQDYLKERANLYTKGIFNSIAYEPSILMSFSKIIPDLILEFPYENEPYGIILKPKKYVGKKVYLFDSSKSILSKNQMPISFIDIPEIVEIVPDIINSHPFIKPERLNGKYIYKNWVPMITEKSGSWL